MMTRNLSSFRGESKYFREPSALSKWVLMNRREMAALFEPSLRELFKMIESQVALVKQKAGRKIDVRITKYDLTASE